MLISSNIVFKEIN